MDDTVLVSRLERGNLTRDGKHLVDREWAALQFFRECLSGQELHDEIELPVRLVQPMERRDVPVVE